MSFELLKQDRKQKHIFGTNFGYDGKELELALSMYGLGFENGFDDLKKTLDNYDDLLKEKEQENQKLKDILNDIDEERYQQFVGDNL